MSEFSCVVLISVKLVLYILCYILKIMVSAFKEVSEIFHTNFGKMISYLDLETTIRIICYALFVISKILGSEVIHSVSAITSNINTELGYVTKLT